MASQRKGPIRTSKRSLIMTLICLHDAGHTATQVLPRPFDCLFDQLARHKSDASSNISSASSSPSTKAGTSPPGVDQLSSCYDDDEDDWGPSESCCSASPVVPSMPGHGANEHADMPHAASHAKGIRASVAGLMVRRPT